MFENTKIILASKSPRRKEYMEKICGQFSILTADTDEALPRGMHPRDGVRILAERKGLAVIEKFAEECTGALIVAADTLVEADGIAFGKPQDKADAERMLKFLRGRAHGVHTGIALFYRRKMLSATDSSTVYFKDCSDEEIKAYVESGEPMDKAGAYGIQGLGGRLVDHLVGEFDTVVGFPSKLFLRLAEEILK